MYQHYNYVRPPKQNIILTDVSKTTHFHNLHQSVIYNSQLGNITLANN